MKYAYGLVDKNNIIRTVEDIMCAGNDTSHETITDFKQEITDKIDDFYTKTETSDHIEEAIDDLKSYFENTEIPEQIDAAIEDLMVDQLPDQYYNQGEIKDIITNSLQTFYSEMIFNEYATKSSVNTTKTDILTECQQSFYTKDYINEHIISTIELEEAIEPLKAKIKELEDRIKVLEGSS